VTAMDSPAATRARTALLLLRSSRWAMVFMVDLL
jgi:hypothetical protein